MTLAECLKLIYEKPVTPAVINVWFGSLQRYELADERETGVLTEEMRIGWTTCQPILDQGDEFGARLAFRGTYAREVEKARKIDVALR